MDESPHRESLPEADSSNLITQLIAATSAARHVLSIWNDNPLKTVRISIEDLRAAFSQIIAARAVLERIPQDASPALSDALSEYREVLEQLNPHLPRFEGWLLAERARLGNRQAHTKSVGSWIESHGETR